jgi:hypothetical protein
LLLTASLVMTACLPSSRPVRRPLDPGPPRLTVGDWVRVRRVVDTTRSVRGRIEASDIDTVRLRLIDATIADTSGLRATVRSPSTVVVAVPWAQVHAVTIPLSVALERRIPSPEIQVREETTNSRVPAVGAAVLTVGCVVSAALGGIAARQAVAAGFVAALGCPLLARAIVSAPVEVEPELGTTEPDERTRWVLVPDARAQLLTSASRGP